MNYTSAQLCVNSGAKYLLSKLSSWHTALTQYSIVTTVNWTENS